MRKEKYNLGRHILVRIASSLCWENWKIILLLQIHKIPEHINSQCLHWIRNSQFTIECKREKNGSSHQITINMICNNNNNWIVNCTNVTFTQLTVLANWGHWSAVIIIKLKWIVNELFIIFISFYMLLFVRL